MTADNDTAGRSTLGPVAIIGGTGQLGRGLAYRWARAGVVVHLGSRDPSKAMPIAKEIAARTGGTVVASDYLTAARTARTIVLTVPYAAQTETAAAIRESAVGKVVIDTTVPLVPPKVMRVQLPVEGSAALRTQQLLGDRVTVVSAFHNVSAAKLSRDADVDCDVLVCGDGEAARSIAIALVEAAGLRGVHAGALVNSTASEALTSVLIFINRTYSVDGAGIRIAGLPAST